MLVIQMLGGDRTGSFWRSCDLLAISQVLGEDRTGSPWRRGGMLAMSLVLEEDCTRSPWRAVLWALVGPELRYSLYVTLPRAFQHLILGTFLCILHFPISGICCHSPFLLFSTPLLLLSFWC